MKGSQILMVLVVLAVGYVLGIKFPATGQNLLAKVGA
jgi:hypothetical protein